METFAHHQAKTCIIACGPFNTYGPFNTFCKVLLLYTLLYCVKGFILCVCMGVGGGLYFFTDTDSHKVNCENLARAENLKIVSQVHGQICTLVYCDMCTQCLFCTQQVDTQFTAAHENKIGPMAVAIFLRHNGGNIALAINNKTKQKNGEAVGGWRRRCY